MMRSYFKRLVIYLYIFLCIIAVLGTFTLRIVIKSTVFFITETGWLAAHIEIIIAAIALICIIFSLLITKWLTIWIFNTKNKKVKIIFFITLSVLLIVSSAYWLIANKTYYKFSIVSTDGRFIGGLYPDAQQLKLLKYEGYTSVISLLNSYEFPLEHYLIKQEENLVKEVGINLIKIPMLLETIYDNSLETQIKQLATTNNKHKYYVHAYRDKERVLKFIRTVNQYNKIAVQARKTEITVPTYKFEAGLAIQVDNNLIVSPKPTDNDLVKFILSSPNSQIKNKISTVISINGNETKAESKNLGSQLKKYDINYISITISIYPYNPDTILNVAKSLKSYSGTVLIYSYFMPPQSTVLTSIILAYLTDLPSLPITLVLGSPLQSGQIEVIAPNIALGNKPIPSEFKDNLQKNGIRAIAYIGPCNERNYIKEKNAAISIGLQWYCYQATEYFALSQSVKRGGPWYVYGPDLGKIQNELTRSKLGLIPNYLNLVK